MARSYVGKDSSKFVDGSAVQGGGGRQLLFADVCGAGLTIAAGSGGVVTR